MGIVGGGAVNAATMKQLISFFGGVGQKGKQFISVLGLFLTQSSSFTSVSQSVSVHLPTHSQCSRFLFSFFLQIFIFLFWGSRRSKKCDFGSWRTVTGSGHKSSPTTNGFWMGPGLMPPRQVKGFFEDHHQYWNHYKHLTGINHHNAFPVFLLMSLLEELLKTKSAFFPRLPFLNFPN